MISVNTKFLVAALVASMSFSPVMAARQTETNEEREQALANYNKYLMIAGGGSAVALAAGFALGNNMLKGIGQGGLSGTASGYLQNEFDLSTLPIVGLWLAEVATRGSISSMIATPLPASTDVSEDLAAANLALDFMTGFSPNGVLRNRPTNAKLTADILKTKATNEVKNPAWIASWAAYLGCYVMHQKVKQATV